MWRTFSFSFVNADACIRNHSSYKCHLGLKKLAFRLLQQETCSANRLEDASQCVQMTIQGRGASDNIIHIHVSVINSFQCCLYALLKDTQGNFESLWQSFELEFTIPTY